MHVVKYPSKHQPLQGSRERKALSTFSSGKQIQSCVCSHFLPHPGSSLASLSVSWFHVASGGHIESLQATGLAQACLLKSKMILEPEIRGQEGTLDP